jgi:hypothetical protein
MFPLLAPSILLLQSCTNFGGVFPVPMDAAQKMLPEGFKPVAAANDPQGGATLYVLALSCAKAIVNGTDLGPATVAYEELAVTPDAAHSNPKTSDYTVPLLFVASPAPLGKAFAGMHLGRVGPGSITWTTTPIGAITAKATLGPDTLTLTGEAPPATASSLPSAPFTMFGVQDKKLVSTITAASAGGSAVQAAILLQTEGAPPLLDKAVPATRGFSVTGFSLMYVEEG